MKLSRYCYEDALVELLVEPDTLAAELDAAPHDRLAEITVEQVMAGLPRETPAEPDAADLVVLRYLPTLMPFSLTSESHAAFHALLVSAGRVAASVAVFLGAFTAYTATVCGVSPGEMLAALREPTPRVFTAPTMASMGADLGSISSAAAWIGAKRVDFGIPSQ